MFNDAYTEYINSPIFSDPNYNLVVIYNAIRDEILISEGSGEEENIIRDISLDSDLINIAKEAIGGKALPQGFTNGKNLVDLLISNTTDVEFRTLLKLLDEKNSRTFEQSLKMDIFTNKYNPKQSYQRFVTTILKYNATNFIGSVFRPKYIPLSWYIVNYKVNLEKFFGTDIYDAERYVQDPKKYEDEGKNVNNFSKAVVSYYNSHSFKIEKELLDLNQKFKFIMAELEKIGFIFPFVKSSVSVRIFNNTMEKYFSKF